MTPRTATEDAVWARVVCLAAEAGVSPREALAGVVALHHERFTRSDYAWLRRLPVDELTALVAEHDDTPRQPAKAAAWKN